MVREVILDIHMFYDSGLITVSLYLGPLIRLKIFLMVYHVIKVFL